MEEEDGGGDFGGRSSPGITRRKKKVYSADSACESDSEKSPKNNYKRKRDFPGKNIATKKQQTVGFKCCPHMLSEFLKQLTDTQRKWVDDLGFGALLLMPDVRLPRDLTLWLINQVDWKRKALIVRGKPIKIVKRHIKKVLDIPDGPFKVPKPGGRRKSKIRKPSEEEKQLRGAKGGCGKGLQPFMHVVLKLTDEVTFKRWFMLVILCVYLAPTSSHFINRNYMPSFANLDIISQMDWCGYIANYLIDGIREYRDSTAANVNVHGCVHILLLIYISLVRTKQLKLPQKGHLSNHCTTDILHQLEAIDLKHNGKDGAVFGILDVDTSGFEDENSSESGEENGDEDLSDSMPCASRLASDRLKSSRQNTNNLDCRRPTRTSVDSVDIIAEMDKIEADYSSRRDKVYQSSFDYLRENMKKLDDKRIAAIKSLLPVVKNKNTGCSRNNDAPSNYGDSDGSTENRSQIKTLAWLRPTNFFHLYDDNDHDSVMTPPPTSPRTNASSAQGMDPVANAMAWAEKGTAVVQESAADESPGVSALSGKKRNREEAHTEGPLQLGERRASPPGFSAPNMNVAGREAMHMALPDQLGEKEKMRLPELLDAARKADALREEEMKKTKAQLREVNEVAKMEKENADALREELKKRKAQLSEANEVTKLEKENADALREEMKMMKAQLSKANEVAKLEKQNADALREELKKMKVKASAAVKEMMDKFSEITSRSDL